MPQICKHIHMCVCVYTYIDRHNNTKDERSYMELYHCEEFTLYAE